MMKKTSLWMLATCFMLLSGCSNDDLYSPNNTMHTLSATAESFGTTSRAGFDMSNNASFFWNNGDAIGVGSESFGQYTTNCTDRSTSATFTGFTSGGYAVYPFSGAKSISNNTLTYEFASSYDYKNNVDTDFFSNMSVDVPMWAQVVGNSLSFKHLGGLFAFKFPNLKAGNNQTFTLTADKRISGQFTVDLTSSAQIETEDATNEEDKKVVISFSLQNDATAVFYVPVPVGTYDISIEVKNGTETFTTSWNGLQVNRRDIRYTSLIATELQGSEATVVASTDKVTEAMANKTHVIVNNITSNVANSTVNIEIPKKDSDTELEHSLAISNIDANTTTIKIDESDGNGSSISKLVISVPTMADAKKLEIDMPNTTVTIAVNGVGTMTLAEATASTSENTLVVDKNVTINKLIVTKGNVRIKKGAVVNEITTELSNKVKIYLEDGATKPSNLDENKFDIISAAEYDLITKFEQGGTQTIILEGDVELTQPLTLTGGNITLNLNGKTITASQSDAIVVTNAAQLTITGNGIVQVEKGANGCAVWAHHNGQVTIENGTFSTNDDADGDRCDCIYAGSTADMSAGTITINGGTFKYDGQNEEGHKFLLNKKDNTQSTITVNGGVFHKFNPAISYGEPNAPVDFVAETSIVVETAEDVFEVLPSENDMVTLSKDMTLYSPIEVNKGNITLNLNGKTITTSQSDAIVVTNTAQLTITGNGIVQVEKGANGCAVWAHHDGQVTIENGTFSTNDDADGDRCDCIYAGSTADMSAGTITINGGTFKYDGENEEGHKFLLNKKDNTESSISVTGGKFYQFNPAISYGEPNAPVNFVAEGYQSIESEENGVKVYTVSKSAE